MKLDHFENMSLPANIEKINKLKDDIEIKFGRKIKTPNDFNALSLEISNRGNESVSVSTLKRIWGYVNSPYSHISESILSILARYLGFKDWEDFKNSDFFSDSSDFIFSDIVDIEKLRPDTLIELFWAPSRQCLINYTGKNYFKVVSSLNSKLEAGDSFKCEWLIKNQPLYCTEIKKGDRIIPLYVAARIRGISEIRIYRSGEK